MGPVQLQESYIWISRRGYVLTIILVVVWPLLSIPAGVFSESYFSFWVLLSIAWGFGAAMLITVLPLIESQDDIMRVLRGMFRVICCQPPSCPDQCDSNT